MEAALSAFRGRGSLCPSSGTALPCTLSPVGGTISESTPLNNRLIPRPSTLDYAHGYGGAQAVGRKATTATISVAFPSARTPRMRLAQRFFNEDYPYFKCLEQWICA